jgi:hypothetical protein
MLPHFPVYRSARSTSLTRWGLISRWRVTTSVPPATTAYSLLYGNSRYRRSSLQCGVRATAASGEPEPRPLLAVGRWPSASVAVRAVHDPSRSYSYAEADVQLREEASKAAHQTDSYVAQATCTRSFRERPEFGTCRFRLGSVARPRYWRRCGPEPFTLSNVKIPTPSRPSTGLLFGSVLSESVSPSTV